MKWEMERKILDFLWGAEALCKKTRRTDRHYQKSGTGTDTGRTGEEMRSWQN